MTAGEWDCGAYGPEGTAHGALCFITHEAGARMCPDRHSCDLVMVMARERAWGAICAGAAAGDPVMTYLKGQFTGPADLLNGGLL